MTDNDTAAVDPTEQARADAARELALDALREHPVLPPPGTLAQQACSRSGQCSGCAGSCQAQ